MKRFHITATVPIEDWYEGNTVEEAYAKFKEDYPDASDIEVDDERED